MSYLVHWTGYSDHPSQITSSNTAFPKQTLMLYLKNKHTLQYHRAYEPQLLRDTLEEEHLT